jgi:hypothetical protein
MVTPPIIIGWKAGKPEGLEAIIKLIVHGS